MYGKLGFFNCPLKFTSWYALVSATFLVVCFLSLKESTQQTSKNAFYLTSEVVFVLIKIKF